MIALVESPGASDDITILVGGSDSRLEALATILERGGFTVGTVIAEDPSCSSSYLLIQNSAGDADRGIDYLRKSYADLLDELYVIVWSAVHARQPSAFGQTIHLPVDLARALERCSRPS